MRVIAGSLGGRVFDTPGTSRTHPMSEKVCGALFNILGDIEGLTVLDAFAGSGALSFEAYSRGASQIVAIESDRIAAQTITRNIASLGLGDSVTLVHAGNTQWMQTNPDKQFDLVICDPPYDNLQLESLQKLAAHVSKDGLLALSWPGSKDAPDLPGLEEIDQRSYGDIQLVFYRNA